MKEEEKLIKEKKEQITEEWENFSKQFLIKTDNLLIEFLFAKIISLQVSVEILAEYLKEEK
jgi:hypothetical protein